MANVANEGPTEPVGLADRAVALASKWVDEGAEAPTDPAAERLAGVLRDPNGLEFTVGFVDGVMRPEDPLVAGNALAALAGRTPRFLPWYEQAAVRTGGLVGPVLPWVVVPAARRVLRGMVGHLIVDSRPRELGNAIAKLRADGSRLNLNLLGEAVLGEGEAAKRLAGTRELLQRPDVDYVSIKVSSIASQLSMWSFEQVVDRIVRRLVPLYEEGLATGTFINLDMEEYRDLDLTIAVFTRLLDRPQLLQYQAGIVIQAYLPDALEAMMQLTAWSKQRVAAGDAPIKVRLVKGANLAMERVDAAIHGWPLATTGSKRETDTNYKRVLDWALTPAHTDVVRVGVAGHNLFDIAYAWLLAGDRGVRERVDFEMLLGMATGQVEAIKRDVGTVLLYTPVVNPKEFDVAISYLVRRLEENASEENFMSAVFELAEKPTLFARERRRFLASVDALGETAGQVPTPNRTAPRKPRRRRCPTTTATTASAIPRRHRTPGSRSRSSGWNVDRAAARTASTPTRPPRTSRQRSSPVRSVVVSSTVRPASRTPPTPIHRSRRTGLGVRRSWLASRSRPSVAPRSLPPPSTTHASSNARSRWSAPPVSDGVRAPPPNGPPSCTLQGGSSPLVGQTSSRSWRARPARRSPRRIPR
jgi:RHH-type proline utilization regulon transcriptional repressor/proline dehydrogenase/delta 1-pyrroline-5-carboxylate dehydrogenase